MKAPDLEARRVFLPAVENHYKTCKVQRKRKQGKSLQHLQRVAQEKAGKFILNEKNE